MPPRLSPPDGLTGHQRGGILRFQMTVRNHARLFWALSYSLRKTRAWFIPVHFFDDAQIKTAFSARDVGNLGLWVNLQAEN